MATLTQNDEEQQYLQLMQDILERGVTKPNRTGINTLSLWVPRTLRFKLWDPVRKARIMPILTTKKINFQTVAKELLWFLRGQTDANILSSQGVKIWDANSSREFLDTRGLFQYRTGDIGPGYGWQWRHFNEPYPTKGVVGQSIQLSNNQGIDQIKNLIQGIQRDPFGRRHIVTAWNPCQLDITSLAPCHLYYQVNIDPNNMEPKEPKYLSAMMVMRSTDVPLGLPFNIASYALLTHMISVLVNLEPKELVIVTGDTHVYVNQVPGCLEQIKRSPTLFPTIEFLKIPDTRELADFKIEDIIIKDYNPQPFINFPFAT